MPKQRASTRFTLPSSIAWRSPYAKTMMEDAVEHNADEPLAYYNLISVYDKCKMFEQAEQARQRLKERFAKRSKTSAS